MNSHQRRVCRRRQERDYEVYLASCAQACKCCRYCNQGTCESVSAGGICERWCDCDRRYDDDREDLDDDYDYDGLPFVEIDGDP